MAVAWAARAEPGGRSWWQVVREQRSDLLFKLFSLSAAKITVSELAAVATLAP